jgi:hypothetical protein
MITVRKWVCLQCGTEITCGGNDIPETEFCCGVPMKLEREW